MVDDERGPLRLGIDKEVYSCAVNEAELGVQRV